MREAAIVSTARTPIGKAYRGAFNDTPAQTLAGHAIRSALDRVGVPGSTVEDVVLGCALPQGATGYNTARQSALRAGLPVTVPGQTIDRQCASGLMAVATAAKQVVHDGMDVVVAGGVESISLVQNDHMNTYRAKDPWLVEHRPDTYFSMLETAEIVAERYGVQRAVQDEMAFASHNRAARAQVLGVLSKEISPINVSMTVVDKATGERSKVDLVVTEDDGVRADTTSEILAGLRPVLAPGTATKAPTVTAGNASQLSDGAAAVVLMETARATALGIRPLGFYRGMAVTGCAPEEMGTGPVTAVPRLLKNAGLTVEDIGLWELNEAFASQAVYCRDTLGIDPAAMNVNGGAIALGHPYGMTGARCVGGALLEGQRRQVQFVVVSMCVGGGMGAAALFEVQL